MRATSSRVPRWFQEIAPDVRDDYGPIHDRNIWRGIKVLVDRGNLLKLDIGMAFAVYIRPQPRKKIPGRLVEAEMTEYMLGRVEIHPMTRQVG